MLNDFNNLEVLITGGTRGIGLATALEFSRLGAQCTLTYAWGSVDEADVLAHFEGCSKLPRLVQADVTSDEETAALFAMLGREAGKLDVLCSNVAMSVAAHSLADYNLRALSKSLGYTTWPMVTYVRTAIETFGRPPRYVLGYSCPGPDHFFSNYDMVALCKSALETLTRYLNYRTAHDQCSANVIRTEWVDTDSARGIFDEGTFEFAGKYFPEVIIPADQVAKASVALCSGLMDAVRGQIINIDNGSRFYQNAMYMYDQQRFA